MASTSAELEAKLLKRRQKCEGAISPPTQKGSRVWSDEMAKTVSQQRRARLNAQGGDANGNPQDVDTAPRSVSSTSSSSRPKGKDVESAAVAARFGQKYLILLGCIPALLLCMFLSQRPFERPGAELASHMAGDSPEDSPEEARGFGGFGSQPTDMESLLRQLVSTLGGERKSQVPTWSGAPNLLRQWLKSLGLWEQETSLPKSKWGLRLYAALTDDAKRIADTVPMDELVTERGYSAILTALMSKYKPYLEAVGPSSVDSFLYLGERGPKESFAAYLARKEVQRQELESQIGEKLQTLVAGRVLLRQANLTEQQQQLLALKMTTLATYEEVIQSLRPLDRLDSLAKAGGLPGAATTTNKTYMTAEPYDYDYFDEDEEEEDGEADDYDYEEDGDSVEDGMLQFEDREYDEMEAVYVQAYNDVRKDLRSRRNERGFVNHRGKKQKGSGKGGNLQLAPTAHGGLTYWTDPGATGSEEPIPRTINPMIETKGQVVKSKKDPPMPRRSMSKDRKMTGLRAIRRLKMPVPTFAMHQDDSEIQELVEESDSPTWQEADSPTCIWALSLDGHVFGVLLLLEIDWIESHGSGLLEQASDILQSARAHVHHVRLQLHHEALNQDATQAGDVTEEWSADLRGTSMTEAYRLGSLWVAPSQAGDVGHLEVFVSLESEPKLVSWTKTCLFTISAFNNYGFVKSFLDRAEALNPDIDCFIWVVADNRYVWTTGGDPTLPGQILDDFPKKWQLVLVEQLQPYMNFSFMELAFRYDMTCFNTAIKPPAFKYIFDRYNASKVLYFDNDIWIMQPLTQIVSALEKYSLVITPHITEEIPLDGLRQDERQIMLAGQFNFGFVAASRSKSAFKFFDWWGQRLRLYGYAEPSKGMHFDQNWADLIVSYYPQEEYFILRDPRYNIAYWNLHYRGAHLYMENGRVMYDSEPAVFMHFSGMSSLLDYDIETISRHQNRFKMVQFPNLRPIFEKYLEMLKAEDAMRWRHVPYGFGMFKDGTPIPYVVRTYFAEILDPVNAGQEASRLFHEVVAFEDPFSVDVTPKVSLLSWMLQGVHHLTVEASAPYWVPEIAWQFHRARPDLMAAFPDPLDRHWESYQAWFRVHGVLTTQFVEAERKRRKKKFKGFLAIGSYMIVLLMIVPDVPNSTP
eukprot:g10825.t1